jgi:3-dehydroquinate synthase
MNLKKPLKPAEKSIDWPGNIEMRKVRVILGNTSYDIHIGSGILRQSGNQLRKQGFSGKLTIITNPTVKALYGKAIEQSLLSAGFTVTFLTIPDGEEQKSLETAGKLYLELASKHVERTTPILALGGGVIGDLAGFVAATYKRGAPLIQIPTTLLAQVDSSIGGKVAVNHGQLKNEVGAFYQPRLVISDINILATLTPKALGDGLAEVIKYGVIRDNRLFSYLEENMDKIKLSDTPSLEEVVFRSAVIKAEVVAKDERDLGLRAFLNYGHTVGHAVESALDFRVSHGEAVAIGMLAAARISREMGILATGELVRLEILITKAGLPTKAPNLDLERLVSVMKHDKKVQKGRVRFILPRSLGEVFITDDVNLSLVKQVLAN